MPCRITAVIPVYNGAGQIRRSLDSVLAQTRPVDEVIVVDDGSTDGTSEIVLGYGGVVRLVRQQNAGAAAARNHGVRKAASEWVAFLDHDDEWLPRKIERQVAVMEQHPSIKLCYCSEYWIQALNGTKTLVRLPPPETIAQKARLGNPFPPSVVIIHKAEMLALGGFVEGLKTSCEDWELFTRFVNTHPVAALPEPMTNYYETASSNSLRNCRGMLENSLSIVDSALLCGLKGIDRVLWRRRIRSVMYHQAAKTAARFGEEAVGYLLHSYREWPFPQRGRRRLALLAGLTVRQVRGHGNPRDIGS
jgi:glycosyltransferase involved in cell wall biosynthesis